MPHRQQKDREVGPYHCLRVGLEEVEPVECTETLLRSSSLRVERIRPFKGFVSLQHQGQKAFRIRANFGMAMRVPSRICKQLRVQVG